MRCSVTDVPPRLAPVAFMVVQPADVAPVPMALTVSACRRPLVTSLRTMPALVEPSLLSGDTSSEWCLWTNADAPRDTTSVVGSEPRLLAASMSWVLTRISRGAMSSPSMTNRSDATGDAL